MNNLFGNSYGGYGTYPYPNQTNNFAQTYSQMQQVPANGNYYYINGIEGAKGFLVQPNTMAVLLDSDSNKLFMKTANPQGQAILRQFELVEILPQNANKLSNTELDKYADKESIKALNDKIDDLNKRFIDFVGRFKPVNKEVNNVQSDAK